MFGKKKTGKRTTVLEIDKHLDSLIEKRIEEKKGLEAREEKAGLFGSKKKKNKKKGSKFRLRHSSKPTGTKKVGMGYSNFGRFM